MTSALIVAMVLGGAVAAPAVVGAAPLAEAQGQGAGQPEGAAPRVSADAVIASARALVGRPYAWGGTGEASFDCSGLVQYVYGRYGYVLPRMADEQFLVGVEVARAALQPGDLVFFTRRPGGQRIGHVGIYIGEGEFIHAATWRRKVTYDRLSSSYYAPRFAGARRLLDLPPGRYATAEGMALRPSLGATPSADARPSASPSASASPSPSATASASSTLGSASSASPGPSEAKAKAKAKVKVKVKPKPKARSARLPAKPSTDSAKPKAARP